MIKYQKDTDNIVTLRLDMSNRSVNIINHEIGKVFLPVLNHLKEEKHKKQLRGIILTSDKKTFLAGGDLDYIYKSNDAQEIFNYAEKLKQFFRDLELPGVPVVAAINGTALGSGFELPLACHYKIAIDKKDVVIGLPEVTLGMMPGSGGNIRLLWLLGIEKAFQVLSLGKRYSPREALAAGIIDELASDEDEMLDKARAWLMTNPEGRQPWDRKGYSIPLGTPQDIGTAQTIARLTAQMVAQQKHLYNAHLAILNTLVEGAKVDFDTACRIESRHFAQLVLSKECKNMIKCLWYDFNAIKDDHNRPKGYGKFRPKKIGIIGAGLMGSGIAQVCAKYDLDVVLKDISKPVAEQGKAMIEKKSLEWVKKGNMKPEEQVALLAHILPTDNSQHFDTCDLVLEAVFESQLVKEKVVKEAEQFMDKYSFFASNTSLIPINALAKASTRPSRFIGLHFFSPAETEPLVEIVRTQVTDQETIAMAYDFVKKIKKTPILVTDSPGFFVARVQNTYILEGIAMILEGHLPSIVEQMGKQSGMPFGSLELADRISLKVVLGAERQAAQHFGEKYIDHPAISVLKAFIETHGRSGKFNGAGFYNYENGEKKLLWQELGSLYEATKKDVSYKELQERLLFVQSLEAIWCLQEGVISSIPDANIGSVLGWGFPAFKGGVLQFVNDYGLDNFIEKCRHFEAQYGQRYKIPKLLLTLQKEGKALE